jgi:hypothetical protein
LKNSKWVVGLVCLLLFIAAVDTIPDPPAIAPPTSHSIKISSVHFGGAFTLLEKEWYRAVNGPGGFEGERFSFRLALEHQPARISPLPRVHHAADTSPPSSSFADC